MTTSQYGTEITNIFRTIEIEGRKFIIELDPYDSDVISVNPHIEISRDVGEFNNIYSPFPPKDLISYKFYCLQTVQGWNNLKFNFANCKSCYDNELTEGNRTILDYALAHLVPAESMINGNLLARFLHTAPTPEAQMFYVKQLDIEVTHAETYGLMAINTMGHKKLIQMQRQVDQEDSFVRVKADFMENYTKRNDITRSQRLFAFACAEGIHFSTLFLIFFWFKSKNLLKEITQANKSIAEDERLHQGYANEINKLDGNLTKVEALDILLEAVDVEYKFCEALFELGELEGVVIDDVKEYIRLIADTQFHEAGFGVYYNAELPESLAFMQSSALIQKGNFYETLDTNYTRGSAAQMMDRWTTAKESDPSADFLTSVF